MKKPLNHLLIVIALFLSISKVLHAGNDIEWEQHGYIKYTFSYNWADSEEDAKYLTGYNLLPGWNYKNYAINLNGEVYTDEHQIEYDFTKEPNLPIDLELYWDNSIFSARYDTEVKIEFPEIKLAYNKNQIDGLEVHTANHGITVFQGEESYIPRSKFFYIGNPTVNEYHLIPNPSAGDIVEHSEVVILDGRILTGGRDYSLNFLSGKLQIFVPLERGMGLEVKFLYIRINEELDPEGGESLQGVVFSKRWQEEYLHAYYFKRGEAVNQVGGLAGQINEGPMRFKGELATSKGEWGEPQYAYQLEGSYNDDKINLSYLTRNIDLNFQEIGVVPYTKGKTSTLNLNYIIEKDLLFSLENSSYRMDDGWSVTKNQQNKAMINYLFNKSQSSQFIVEIKERKIDEVVERSGDVALGYTLKTKPITLSVGQSLSSKENRFAKLTLDYDMFRILGNYQLENLFDGKEHQASGEVSFRPVTQLDINSIIDYRRRLDEEKGKWWISVNNSWNPTNAWSVMGSYLYFNNPKYDSYTQRYNGIVNYSTSRLNSNLGIMKSKTESATGLNDKLDMNFNLGWIFLKHYQLNYQLIQDNTYEYIKFYDMVNQNGKNQYHTLNLNYTWRDFYVFSTNLKYSNKSMQIMDAVLGEQAYSGSVGCSYQKDLEHQFMVEVGVEEANDILSLGFDSRVKHPIGVFILDYLGKVNYEPAKKCFTKSLFTYNLTLPKLWVITPILTLHSDFSNTEMKQRLRKYAGKLEYQWKEKQKVFVEVSQEELINWLDHNDDYSALGIFSGVEIDY